MNSTENKMIDVSKNFQASVNIAFDFDSAEKLEEFIPTAEAVKFIDGEILSARDVNSSEQSMENGRAGILIGPYGKGKSYIVLETISLLYNSPDLKKSFFRLAEKIKEKNPGAAENIKSYVNSGKRLLPIVINGNSQSLSQSFLYALNLTLKKKEFAGLMPETHFEAAAKMIEKWENEYPETLRKFGSLASVKPAEFKRKLRDFDSAFFEEFEELYPSLTSGSEFNPFSGFDVVDVYEQACRKICAGGMYDGIFVVYDEFGKYLESSISHATVKDTKLLQDFAERCERSGKNQLHLLLICHKEIENYIDVLPKQKVDGWKGVSERFRHIHLYNNFSEVYSLMEAAVLKNPSEWKKFREHNKAQFENLQKIWFGNGFRLFSNADTETAEKILYGCYPLHPAASYILPRISEKIAQNERTLFTFLSGNGRNGFSALIQKNINYIEENGKIVLFTPDVLFDYFESQLQNEPYTSEIKKYYLVAKGILRRLEENSLESKIVKTLALVYSLNQFERLSPDLNFIFALYEDAGFSREKIRAAVKTLSENFGAVYLNVHNNYLQLKSNSGADIPSLISDCVEKRRRSVRLCDILNKFNTQKFIYPVSYNIEKKMTRYFRFAFISKADFLTRKSWKDFASTFNSDGCVLAVFDGHEDADSENAETETLVQKAIEISAENKQLVFIISRQNEDFSEKLRRFDAAAFLRSQALAETSVDSVLFEEYDVVYRDLLEVVKQIVHSYIQPERNLARYFSGGAEQKLYRKSALTSLVSEICREIFCRTPVVNNEMLNKNCLTGAATKSRAKLIDAMLNSQAGNLGLEGSGQEVSFMRSVLLRTGILRKNTANKSFCLAPETEDKENDKNFRNLFEAIEKFFAEAEEKETNFSALLDSLLNPGNGIALRRGLVPVYIAAAICPLAKNSVVRKNGAEVPLDAESLCEIPEKPAAFTLRIQKWSDEKACYIGALENIFRDFVAEDEKNANGYSYLVDAMARWYRSLPKYTKQLKKYSAFMNVLKQSGLGAHEILFEKIPKVFEKTAAENALSEISGNVKKAKIFLDVALADFEESLARKTKEALGGGNTGRSLKNIAAEFCRSLAPETESHVFENGAHSLLKIYKSAGNDEIETVRKMAEMLSGLNVDDWSCGTEEMFFSRMAELNKTLLDFKDSKAGKIEKSAAGDFESGDETGADNYVVRFAGKGGNTRKSFKKTECSRRAALLEDEIMRTIEEMGQSVTDAEKRQVLVNLLEKLC